MTNNRLLVPVGKFSDLSSKQRNKLFRGISEMCSESEVDDKIQSMKNVNHRKNVRNRLKRLRSGWLAMSVHNAAVFFVSTKGLEKRCMQRTLALFQPKMKVK